MKKYFDFVKKYRYPLMLIGFSIITHLEWFNPFNILTASDWYFWSDEATKELWYSWGTWINFWHFGSANIQIPFIFFMSLWSLITNLGFSYDLAAKITFLIPIAFLGFIAPYVLFKKLIRNEWISFTVALFYGTITYFLVRQTAHLPIAFVYALSPFILYFFIIALEKNKFSNWLIFITLYFIAICYEIRIVFITSLILLIYSFFYLDELKKCLKNIFKVSILLIGVNLFWVLPVIFGEISKNISSVANRGLFGNHLFNIYQAFTIFDSPWTGNYLNKYFISQPIIWYFWLIPILIIIPFLFNKSISKYHQKMIIFFGFISLIGIFLTKQSGEPFSDVYLWLYSNFPGFNLFREASKFYLITAIGYMGLLGFTLLSLKENKNKILNKYLFIGFSTIIILMSIWNTKPLITGEIGTMFIPKHIPNDYLILEDYILEQPEYFRTFWVPRFSRWGIYTNNHPKIGNVSIISATSGPWNNFFEYSVKIQVQEKIINTYTKHFSNQLFDSASVKYVIVPLQDIENDDNFFIFYGGTENKNIRDYYIQELDKIDFLEKINIGTEKLVIYENKDYKPHIFSIDNIYTFNTTNNLEQKYSFITSELKNEFSFVVGNETKNDKLTILNNLFESIGQGSIENKSELDDFSSESSEERLRRSGNIVYSVDLINKDNANFVFVNKSKTDLYYEVLPFSLESSEERLRQGGEERLQLDGNDEIDEVLGNLTRGSSQETGVNSDDEIRFNSLKLVFFEKFNNGLFANENRVGFQNDNENILDEEILDSEKKYFISFGTQLILVRQNEKQRLGANNENTILSLYSTDNQNLIPNADFQKGLWSKEVGDCHNYDDRPILDMRLGEINEFKKEVGDLDNVDISEDSYDKFLQLEATRHIACTTNNFEVAENSEYLFSFDYQSPNAKRARYYLQFNDENKTVISENIFIKDNTKWQTYTEKIKSPFGATEARLFLYAISVNENTNIINRYDNFSLLKLDLEKEIETDYKPEFEKYQINLAENNVFKFTDPDYAAKNEVENGSFENELWQEKVGDCHNYDKDPDIGMSQSDFASDGEKSLQLEARRHNACVSTTMTVRENVDYLFSFDYQSPNAKRGGYYLQFNDEEKTTFSGSLKIENEDWQAFNQRIKAPLGANSAVLYVYAYGSNKKEASIVRYDNFRFTELPDLEDRFYLVSDPELNLKEPKSVEFGLVNPTKKIVHIKGASTPFFLAMSESFHPQWQLEMNNEKVNGFWNKWIPFIEPDKVSDDDHFELNGFLNTWYVDPARFCNATHPTPNGAPLSRGESSGCVRNADGSYDLEMVIEFTPQRWFYLGLLISTITLLGCLGYLGWDWRKRRKKSKGSSQRH